MPILSDSRGRVLAETRSLGQLRELVPGVRVAPEVTLFLLYGDWFAFLARAVLLVSVVRVLKAPPR